MDPTHAEDYKEHDTMTTSLLAEHLGVPLWIVMEIARWQAAKPRPMEEKERSDDMPKDELEDILREFIPHSAEYCIKDLSSAIKRWILEKKLNRVSIDDWAKAMNLEAK